MHSKQAHLSILRPLSLPAAALFLLDVHYEVYVWVGWWPVQSDARFREKNQFTGDAFVRFTRDKRLAMETAINYAKGMHVWLLPRSDPISCTYRKARTTDCCHTFDMCDNITSTFCFVPLRFNEKVRPCYGPSVLFRFIPSLASYD